MAKSRVRIFNPLGYLIEEIDVATKRSWVLNAISDVGRCTFEFPIYAQTAGGGFNPKATLANFQYGNFVLVEHAPSQSADGSFNGILPPWVGVIVPPQDWSYGKISVTAYQAEHVLKQRAMFPWMFFASSPPGAIFAGILQNASDQGGIPIQPGSIDLGQAHLKLNINTNGLDDTRLVQRLSNGDFSVTPSVSSSNRLTLLGNWYPKKGIDTGLVLSNYNLLDTNTLYSESGEFYNTVYGISDASTDGSRVVATAVNAASRAASGIISTNQIFPNTQGAGVDVIQAMADAFLAAHSKPVRTFAPTVLDVGNAFSFCDVGNTLRIENDTVGFQNGGIGINGTIRVTAMEFDDMSNRVQFTGVLQ